MTAHKDLRSWHLDLVFGRAQFNNFSRGGLKHNSIVMVIYELSSALLLLVGYCCCIVADICNISAELAIHLWHPLRPRIRAYVSVSAKDIIQWAATANGLLQLQQMFGASFGEMPFKLGQHLNEVLNDIWEWPKNCPRLGVACRFVTYAHILWCKVFNRLASRGLMRFVILVIVAFWVLGYEILLNVYFMLFVM